MNEFRLRASCAGKLMTNGRGKDAGMGATAKSYCEEWLISELTGKEKEIESKYLTRGNDAEEWSINRIGNYYGKKLEKNEVYLHNEFFQGTFDTMIQGERVIDAKTPWYAFTFPFFMKEPPKDYYYQLQIYMELTGLKKASLCYCLENGTEEQINLLAWKLAKKEAKTKDEDDVEMTMEHWEQAGKQLNYDHLPNHLRIKVFEFDYDAELIEKMKLRVLDARDYIKNELLTQIK